MVTFHSLLHFELSAHYSNAETCNLRERRKFGIAKHVARGIRVLWNETVPSLYCYNVVQCTANLIKRFLWLIHVMHAFNSSTGFVCRDKSCAVPSVRLLATTKPRGKDFKRFTDALNFKVYADLERVTTLFHSETNESTTKIRRFVNLFLCFQKWSNFNIENPSLSIFEIFETRRVCINFCLLITMQKI